MNFVNHNVKKRIVSVALLYVLCMLPSLQALALPDGFVEQGSVSNDFVAFDVNNITSIINCGMVLSSAVRKTGRYSAMWANQDSITGINIKNLPRDLTKYTQFEFWLYSDTGIESSVEFNVLCDNATTQGQSYFGYLVKINWVGWHKVIIPIDEMTVARNASLTQANCISLSTIGWNQTPNPNAVLYFDSIKLRKVEKITDAKLALKYELQDIIQNEVIVYDGCNNVLKNAEQLPMAEGDESVKTSEKDGQTYVPTGFFEKFLGAKLKGGLDINKEIINGTEYVPLEECTMSIGKKAVAFDGLTFVTDKDDLSELTNNEDTIKKIKRYITYVDLKNAGLTKDDFLQFESRWRFNKIGNEEQDRSDSYVDNMVKSYENSAKKIQSKITKDPSLLVFGETNNGKAEQVGRFYDYIRTMSMAYELKSASTYHNEELKGDILYTLGWMYDNMYGPKVIKEGFYEDWWTWQIGAPICLLDSLVLMKNELTQEQINKYLEPVNHFVPDTVKTLAGTVATGANKVHISYVAMCTAIMQRNVERYQSARDGLSEVFEYTSSGDGFYTDGTFIQHKSIPYNGAYGVELIMYLTNLMLIVSNSKFEITDPIAQNQFDWIFNAYEPLIYKGSVMSMVSGRNTSTNSENFNGLRFFKSLLKMASYADDEAVKNRLKAMIKYYINNNSELSIETMTLTEIDLLHEVMDDETIPERQDYKISKTFYNMDRVTQQNENYAVGLAMSSSRICGYESIRRQNMKGWYTGDGMTYLYIGNDVTQYDTTYWKTADPYKRPGTTVDTQKRDEISFNSVIGKDFVGGVSQGMCGAAAMFLDSYSYSGTGTYLDDSGGNRIPIPQHNCTLEAQKSWFMFDDEVVALGAGIVSSDNVTVETIVENRKLYGNEALSINGETVICQPGNEDTRDNVQFANIEGTGGYFFPTGIQLKARKTDTAPSFYEMWIDHGNNPSNASYAYVLLPAKTVDQTREYSLNPDIEILSNTKKLQAVREKNLGVTGYVFWESGALQMIQADMPCVVMVSEKDGKITVSVSDPTHKLKKGSIIVKKANLKTGTADKGMQVVNESGKTTIQIDFTAKPAGDTFNVEFSE